MANVHAEPRHAPSLRDAAERHRTFSIVLLVVTAFATVVGLWIWAEGAERRAISSMTAGERGALFEETRRNTEALCAQARTEPGLQARCADAAEFLLVFPECDAACQTFARSFLSQPAR